MSFTVMDLSTLIWAVAITAMWGLVSLYQCKQEQETIENLEKRLEALREKQSDFKNEVDKFVKEVNLAIKD